MKRFLFFVTVMALINCYMLGQNNDTLVIELTTNSDPEETSWVLFSVDDEIVDKRSDFLGQKTHFDTVLIDRDGCYYWELKDSRGDGFEGLGSSQDGDFKIYFNGNLVAQCEDPDFGSKFTVYNLGSNCSTNDIEVMGLNVTDNMYYGEFYFEASVKNTGAENFTSLTCCYSVNDIISDTIQIPINIGIGKNGIIQHPIPVYFKTAEEVSVTFSVIDVNGQLDQKNENNSVTKQATVKDGYLKKPMHEVATSSTCGGCPAAAEWLGNLFKKQPGMYSAVKYQVWWPDPGDPYCVPKYAGPRIQKYYEINGAPTFVVNGEVLANYGNYTEAVFNSNIGNTTNLGLEVEGFLYEDSVIVKVIMVSTVDVNLADHVLHTVIVENETTENIPPWNHAGQTEFHYVLMEMLPDVDGVVLPNLKANEPYTITLRKSMKGTHIEEMDDLKAVVFIQNNESKEVIQSNMENIPTILSFSTNQAPLFDIDAQITITCNELMRNLDNSLIDDFSNIIKIYESDDASKTVAYTASINDASNEIKVVPSENLAYNTNYTVSFTNVENSKNVILGELKSTFSTCSGIAPQFTFSTDDQDFVQLDDTIIIGVNEAIRNINNTEISNIKNNIEFFKVGDSGSELNYSATLDKENNVITIIPAEPMEYNTKYTVSVINVENYFDLASENATSTFTTVSASSVQYQPTEIEVYPNPVKNTLFVNNKAFSRLELFDVSGTLIMHCTLVNGENKINVQNMQKGMYFGVFSGDKFSETIKIIIE